MIRRRAFITLLGRAAVAWPVAARAQQGDRVRLLVAMMGGRNADTDPEGRAWFVAFRQALQELGWVEGRNFRSDYRWPAGDLDRMRAIAKEFVDLKPDVIFAGNTPSVEALLSETHTIPIVFANLADPVGTGLIESLARPGGNATGFAGYEYSLGGKWLEMLKEIAPRMSRVAVIRDPAVAGGSGGFAAIQTVAPSFGVELTPIGVRTADEIERSIVAFARSGNGGVIVVGPTSSVQPHRNLIIALATQHRLPAIYTNTIWSKAGGLISYGPDNLDQYRRAAGYVDRILRGEKPADLPIQQPTKFELVINLKTAKAMGIELPPTLLARVDEVIE